MATKPQKPPINDPISGTQFATYPWQAWFSHLASFEIVGPQGPAGKDGTNGTNGVDGAPGPQGPAGPAMSIDIPANVLAMGGPGGVGLAGSVASQNSGGTLLTLSSNLAVTPGIVYLGAHSYLSAASGDFVYQSYNAQHDFQGYGLAPFLRLRNWGSDYQILGTSLSGGDLVLEADGDVCHLSGSDQSLTMTGANFLKFSDAYASIHSPSSGVLVLNGGNHCGYGMAALTLGLDHAGSTAINDLGALGGGVVKAAATTGLLSIASLSDFGSLGTLNYLAKFGTTGLAQSLIFDNGANVGIGTVSPAMLLDIQKATATYGDVAQRLMAYGNNIYPPYFYLAKSRGTSVGSLVTTQTNDILGIIAANGVSTSNTVVAAAGLYFVQDGAATSTYVPTQFQWWNYGTQLMTLTSGGYLGIGTTSPNTTLDVNGGISLGRIKVLTAAYSSSPYAMLATDGTLVFTNADAGSTQYITLQSAASYPGRILTLMTVAAVGSSNVPAKLLSNAGNDVILISGGSAQGMILWNAVNSDYSVTMQSDGTYWRILHHE